MPERKITLLHIEDDETAAKAIRLAINGHFHGFETVHSLRDGLARLDMGGIGCVLVDLRLPDAVGVDAVEQLQRAHPEVPIVVLTGATAEWDSATLAGAQAVLIKPVSAETIVTAIHHAVIRHRVRSRYEPATSALQAAADLVEGQLRGGNR